LSSKGIEAGWWILIASSCLLAACAPLNRLDAVPASLESQTRLAVADVPGPIRYRVGDAAAEAALGAEFVESWTHEREYLSSQGQSGPLPPTAFLAVSGGGDNGAFTAGLLNGWTASGSRPEFKLVTGISTGALIAPFAFLGPAQDASLKEFYTTTSSKDVLKARNVIAGLTSDAMADTQPLRRLLKKHVDRAFLDAIAAEYRKGRELWIATTNLDSLDRYIWNMTLIASSRDPGAVDLFVSLMLASAAIPGQFPPVLIDVDVNGRKYQEMHVDGGAMAQVFVYPIGLDFEALAKRNDASRERRLYVIRNARLDPEWAQTERRTLSIAGRALASLIQAQGVGDLYRIYLAARRDGLDFNLAHIPASFEASHEAPFDTGYMRSLYDVGYEAAVHGYPWEKAPPGYARDQVNPLVGAWRLVRYEDVPATGPSVYPFGDSPQGLLIYEANGQMSIQVMKQPHPRVASVVDEKITPEEKQALLDSFMAYFGTYAVDERRGVVTHHVDGDLWGVFDGKDEERPYELSEDRLTLKPQWDRDGQHWLGIRTFERVVSQSAGSGE